MLFFFQLIFLQGELCLFSWGMLYNELREMTACF